MAKPFWKPVVWIAAAWFAVSGLAGCSTEPAPLETGTVVSIPPAAVERQEYSATPLDMTADFQAASPYPYLPQDSDYQSLENPQTQELYQELEESVWQISDTMREEGDYYLVEEIVLEGTIPEEQIRMAIIAFKNDNPQVFWLTNLYWRSYTGDTTRIQLYSYVSEWERDWMQQELQAEIEGILSGLPADLEELDREIYLFDAVSQGCVYDNEAAQDPSQWEAYTSYGALVQGEAVCEGYARAMQQLLSYAGMRCRLVHGTAGGESHMWNLVEVDGQWYHLDPTWNDQKSLLRYDYFNLDDEAISQDHQIGREITGMSEEELEEYMESSDSNYNFPLPSCESDDANYLKNKGILLSNFSESSGERIVSDLLAAARNQEEAVYFYVAEDVNYDMLVNQFLNMEPYQLMTYLREVNEKLYDSPYRLDLDNIQYLLGEISRGISVKLSYEEA